MAIIYIHALSNEHCSREPDFSYISFHWYIQYIYRFHKIYQLSIKTAYPYFGFGGNC